MPARIAHVISTRGVGGAERLLAAVITELEARGHEQLLLNPFAGASSDGLASICRPVPYRGHGCNRVVHLPRLRRWLRTELDHFRPDAVHVLLFHARVLTATIPRRPATRWLLTQVYDETLRLRPHPRTRQALDRWSGRHFDRIVAISASVERFLVDEHGYPPSKVVRISPGWEGPPVPRNPSQNPTVVCVAKFRAEKGHGVLLEAFDLLLREVPDARLLLVGDGDLEGEVRAQVAARGMEGRVEFAGAVGEVWPFLARSHVFVLPSLSEAFGIAAVEAMAAGLPVVASEVGGLPELIRPGVTGELFPPGDHQALAAHLVRLVRSPEERERMGAAAHEDAQPLRMDRAAGRYADLFEELIGADVVQRGR